MLERLDRINLAKTSSLPLSRGTRYTSGVTGDPIDCIFIRVFKIVQPLPVLPIMHETSTNVRGTY